MDSSSHSYQVRAWNNIGPGNPSSLVNGNAPDVCSVGGFTCSGSVPANGYALSPTENNPPASGVNWTYSTSDTSAYCEYECDASYINVSGRCVSSTLDAIPTSVISGGTSQISWSTTNSTGLSCAVNSWSGVSGLETTPPLLTRTLYTLSCDNVHLKQVYVSITGTTPTLSATPRVIPQGATTKLIWDTKGKVGCTLGGGGNTFDITSGTTGMVTTPTLTNATTYTLDCTTVGGQRASTKVEVLSSGYET